MPELPVAELTPTPPSQAVTDILKGIKFPEVSPDQRPNTLGYVERLINTNVDKRLTLVAIDVRFSNTRSGHYKYLALNALDEPTRQEAKVALLRPEIILDDSGKRAPDDVILQRITEALDARSRLSVNPYLVDGNADWRSIPEYVKAVKGSFSGHGPDAIHGVYTAFPVTTSDMADDADRTVACSGSSPERGIWKEGGGVESFRGEKDYPIEKFDLVEFAQQSLKDYEAVRETISSVPTRVPAPVA